MRTFNFKANTVDFGNYKGIGQNEAQESFAKDAGYKDWDALMKQVQEVGMDEFEVLEVFTSTAGN